MSKRSRSQRRDPGRTRPFRPRRLRVVFDASGYRSNSLIASAPAVSRKDILHVSCPLRTPEKALRHQPGPGFSLARGEAHRGFGRPQVRHPRKQGLPADHRGCRHRQNGADPGGREGRRRPRRRGHSSRPQPEPDGLLQFHGLRAGHGAHLRPQGRVPDRVQEDPSQRLLLVPPGALDHRRISAPEHRAALSKKSASCRTSTWPARC